KTGMKRFMEKFILSSQAPKKPAGRSSQSRDTQMTTLPVWVEGVKKSPEAIPGRPAERRRLQGAGVVRCDNRLMRITAGEYKGRNLVAPGDATIRPTSDKVRQAIFNLVEHHPQLKDFSLAGVRVIDLFAGTGALGLEALSRGACYCLFVDHSTEGRALI